MIRARWEIIGHLLHSHTTRKCVTLKCWLNSATYSLPSNHSISHQLIPKSLEKSQLSDKLLTRKFHCANVAGFKIMWQDLSSGLDHTPARIWLWATGSWICSPRDGGIVRLLVGLHGLNSAFCQWKMISDILFAADGKITEGMLKLLLEQKFLPFFLCALNLFGHLLRPVDSFSEYSFRSIKGSDDRENQMFTKI